jgi:hypothetical protein
LNEHEHLALRRDDHARTSIRQHLAPQQPQLMRAGDGLEARVRPEPEQDVTDVIPHRLLAQVKHGGDVLRRCALAEQLQNLVLTGRQAHRVNSGQRGWAQHGKAEHGMTDVSAGNED